MAGSNTALWPWPCTAAFLTVVAVVAVLPRWRPANQLVYGDDELWRHLWCDSWCVHRIGWPWHLEAALRGLSHQRGPVSWPVAPLDLYFTKLYWDIMAWLQTADCLWIDFSHLQVNLEEKSVLDKPICGHLWSYCQYCPLKMWILFHEIVAVLCLQACSKWSVPKIPEDFRRSKHQPPIIDISISLQYVKLFFLHAVKNTIDI